MPNADPPERVNYFEGKLLSAEDLSHDQAYQLERHRRHNRFMHGWGVVSGLSVSVTDDGTITIEPGFAIDCAGNELVLVKCMHAAAASLASRCFVCIRYSERFVQPVPSATGVTAFARVQECVIAELLEVDPAPCHEGAGPGTPGCGSTHPLCLATIEQRQGRWCIVAKSA